MNRVPDILLIILIAIVAIAFGTLSYFGNIYTLIGLTVFAAMFGYFLSTFEGNIKEQAFVVCLIVISAIIGSRLNHDDAVKCAIAAVLGLCGFVAGVFLENYGRSYPASQNNHNTKH